MKTKILYTYLGTNGTITSPVFLENIYSIKKYQLIADDGMVLTKDNKNYTKTTLVSSQNEIQHWKEVTDKNI